MAVETGIKNKLTHHVAELFAFFGFHSNENTESFTFADQLEKSVGPYNTTQVLTHSAKSKLTHKNPQAVDFLRKYEELKLKNIKELDALVFILSKIKEDDEIRRALEGVSGSIARSNQGSHRNLGDIQKKMANVIKKIPTESIRRTVAEKQRGKSIETPLQPDWLFDRPYQSFDYVVDDFRQDHGGLDICNLPIQLQEQAIVDDLLNCLQGIEGTYIKPLPLLGRYEMRKFHVDATLDRAFAEVVEQILPICCNYSVVVRFIEEKSAFEYGGVNQALAAAIRSLMKDYMVLVCQLDQQHRTGNVKLSRLLFYLQDTARFLEALAGVTCSINTGECLGGAVLSLLHDLTKSSVGEPKLHQLYLYLMQSASVPFFEILQKWIYRGVVSDPCNEFFIEESRSRGGKMDLLSQEYINDYWEKRYTIAPNRVPTFLEQYTTRILNTGKYLNVVHQCGSTEEFPTAEEIVYGINERQYVDQIDRAYSFSSRLLLNLMLKDKELKERLKSVKHYFLLDQGDFIVHFMDSADNELKKPATRVTINRLESLLELALRTSTAKVDQQMDNLKVVLLPFDLITQMFNVLSIQAGSQFERASVRDIDLTGLESFSFDYQVSWPLSLVLNRQTIERYQMLFRHLFYCKHVERLLCNVWISNKAAKRFPLQSNPWFASAFALRQKMLIFVQHFQYYMTFEVIEPRWIQFFQSIDKASNLDDILDWHLAFLRSCLIDCMLTNSELLRVVHKLMMVCVTFSNFMQRISSSTELQPEDRDRSKNRSGAASHRKTIPDSSQDMIGSDSCEMTIETFDGNFTSLLIELLNKIKDLGGEEGAKLMHMNYRLDFNGYYTARDKTSTQQRTTTNQPSASFKSGTVSQFI